MIMAEMKSDYYQGFLDEVSRSFAFCIRELREPLRSQVALAYLLCRILDTNEDAHFTDRWQQLRLMNEFGGFLIKPPSRQKVALWLDQMPLSRLESAERRLLNETYSLMADYHALPERQKQILKDTVLSMKSGMAYFLRATQGSTGLQLKSLTDLNRYCFFVAGIVGEMLTRLVSASNRHYPLTPERLLRSHQFGLFLQKINILKDQLKDEEQGRRLVDSVDDIWSSLSENAQGAFQYLIDIPLNEKEYRLFCAWSLFLGLASIPYIKISWAKKYLNKIPRALTQRILTDVSAAVFDNEKLALLFAKMKLKNSKGISFKADANGQFQHFHFLYRGHVPNDHLGHLGMLEMSHEP